MSKKLDEIVRFLELMIEHEICPKRIDLMFDLSKGPEEEDLIKKLKEAGFTWFGRDGWDGSETKDSEVEYTYLFDLKESEE